MKKCFAMLVLFALFLGVSAEDKKAPIAEFDLRWEDGSSIAETLEEKSDYAIVDGKKIKYWLYNTYYVSDDIKEEFFMLWLPGWLQTFDYTIDYQRSHMSAPNELLAESVKNLMRKHNSNISICLIEEDEPFFVINEDLGGNIYKTLVYHFME